MQDRRIGLITGANQGVGRQVAKELVANGLTVLVGSRNFERGEAAQAIRSLRSRSVGDALILRLPAESKRQSQRQC